MTINTTRIISAILALALAISTSLTSISFGFAQANEGFIRHVPSMESEEIGTLNPVGLSFSSKSKTFYVVETQGQAATVNSDVIGISSFADRKGAARIAAIVEDPLNLVFDNQNSRLLAFLPATAQLLEVRENASGILDRSTVIRHNVRRLGIQDPQGMTLDEAGGGLFILDAGGPRIVRVQLGPGRNFTGGRISVINLQPRGLVSPRGIAFDPSTGHLHVLDLSNQTLYELTQRGQIVATRDMSQFALKNPQAMVFAPSGDQTDDAAQMSLFLADNGLTSGRAVEQSASPSSSGQIMEFSLEQPAALPNGTTLLPSTLVRIIDTSNAAWNPSAPDPAGADYWPLTGGLLIADSEVDEMSNYFTGKNVFDSTLSGTLVSTCSTTNLQRTGFSNEPTGLAIDPNNNRVYYSDDDSNKIFEVSRGPDNTFCTSDDILTTVNVGSVYNLQDAEDIAYGNNTIFIAGGTDAEVYILPLGANHALAGGDDGPLTRFDTAALGFNDLEGLGYNGDNGTLFLVSDGDSDKYLGETTITGALLNAWTLDYAGLSHREDVAYAPGSQNSAIKNMYVVDRGADNDNNPNENDGQIWEIHLSNPGTPTPPPSSNPFFASFESNGTVAGLAFADEDILNFDGSIWSLFFDGSDVGVGAADVFAFYLLDQDSILLAFRASVTVGGQTYAPTDIVRFDATSLGLNTAGTFSMYFNGADVGLDATGEKIDALSVLPDGKILVSTTGDSSVPGVSGRDEDVLAVTPITLGNNTSGTWTMYFDGSDVGLADTSSEDVDSLEVVGGNLYLSTLDNFSVNGVVGAGEDIFICVPTSLGDLTACNYVSTLFFDGSAWGLAGNDLDGLYLAAANPIPTATPTNTPTNTPIGPTFTPTPTSTNTPIGPTFTPTSTPTPTNTPGSSDVIFADSFESGNLSAWSGSSTDGGDLSVSSSAALVGSQGLQAVIDDTNALYVTDDRPNAEPRYRMRFYFDPNSISMANGDTHLLLRGYSGSTIVLRVEFGFSAGGYQIRAALLSDNSSWTESNFFPISDDPHFIELDWRAATAAGTNDGGLTIWIDGVQQVDLINIDNDTWRIDRARLGAVASLDAGTSGTYFFDSFESRRQTYIGP
jgi:hypothetical protein